ncbi:DUF1240 domain-containing protein [Vibrio crassostreae]|nr:DUF1240 domain-containing protein [Vibrio crassostreae]
MIRILLSLLLILVSSYTSYATIKPLLLPIEQIDKVLFSNLALPFIATWGIAFFSVMSFSLSVKSLVTKSKYRGGMKLFYCSLCLGAIVGIGVNYANYFLVIEPNNMFECPKKIGYKKNLMRDYVADLSLCEKF